MARVVLGPALARWLDGGSAAAGERAIEVDAATIADALARVFDAHPALRGYVVDEHGAIRHHLALFVDGTALRDKRALDRAIAPHAEVWVMQALSGG
ncbi:MAG TPA: hypothetical protein VFL14_15535 [Xanthomonadales bacterium]|nr:hypothetical protein [Xanthomonadales bacterium]